MIHTVKVATCSKLLGFVFQITLLLDSYSWVTCNSLDHLHKYLVVYKKICINNMKFCFSKSAGRIHFESCKLDPAGHVHLFLIFYLSVFSDFLDKTYLYSFQHSIICFKQKTKLGLSKYRTSHSHSHSLK